MTGIGMWSLQVPPSPSEWEVVGFSDDPVAGADLDRVEEARFRYARVAQTIESAVARLRSITSSEDQLRGEYADAMREKATKVYDGLAKAAVRYTDVAREVAIYQPELEDALTQTRGGLAEAKAATGDLAAAEALPGGQPDDDGVLDAAGVAADAEKANRIATADATVAAARKRVQGAFDRLQVAGKRLGDAVTARNYDDGLTDSGWDKAIAVLKRISKVLAIIGMVLAVLCFIFPGVAALLAVAAVVAVAALVVGSILYAKGAEGLPDLIFAVLGVVFLGGAVVATAITRGAAVAGRAAHVKKFGTLTVPAKKLLPGGKVVIRINPGAGRWKMESDWFDNPLTQGIVKIARAKNMTPEVAFWRSSVDQFRAAKAMWSELSLSTVPSFLKSWGKGVSGIAQYQSIKEMRHLTGVTTSKWWAAWGGGNSLFTFGTGLIWTGGRTEWRDWRDQWIPDYRPDGDA